MARASQELTQAEIDLAFKFLTDHNVYTGGEIGTQNANQIVDFLVNTWNVDITEETLKTALERLGNRIRFYTASEMEFKSLAGRMNDSQRDLILSLITSRGLKDSGEEQLKNFNSIASYFLSKNIPIEASVFDTVVGRITTSGKKPLLWKPRLQQSEAAAAKEKEEAEKQQQPAKAEDVVIPPGLPAYLHDHYRAMHRKSVPEDVVSSQPVNADSHFKDLAESAVASIASNNDRAEAQKLLGNIGKWGAELVYRQIMVLIERRKHQRSLVGR